MIRKFILPIVAVFSLVLVPSRTRAGGGDVSFLKTGSAAAVEREVDYRLARKEHDLKVTRGSDGLVQALRDDGYSIDLMRSEFFRLVGKDEVQSVARGDKGKEFLDLLFNDRAWLEMLLASGPLGDKPGRVLEMLYNLWSFDPDCARFISEKTLATAYALEYGRRDWPAEAAREHYLFFRDSKRAGKLHPSYDQLETWEKRYLAGLHYRNWYGKVESLQWLRDNVKLPIDQYRGACWQVPYRGHNIFGDSVQGSMYYYPFQGAFDSFALMARFVGAVCGRLSGYGSAAAIANGIPATTMGEPGHCAYAVRIKPDQWAAAYSLSWRRGVHFQMYGNKWSMLVLDNRNFREGYQHLRSQQHLWQARRFKQKEPELVNAAYALAIKAQPSNYPIWREYAQWRKSNRNNISDWSSFQKHMLAALAADYPEIAWTILENDVYPSALKQLDNSGRMAFMGKFHEAIDSWGPARWDFERALSKQLGYLDKSDESQFGFTRGLIHSHMESKSYLSALLAWGQQRYGKDADKRDTFFRLVMGAVRDNGADGNEGALLNMCSEAIRAAERNKDHEAFLAIGRIIDSVQPPLTPEQRKLGQNLLSKGGMVRTSSVSQQYDKRSYLHWNLIGERPGFFHTEAEQDPWIEVTLPHFGLIERLDIVNRDSHRHRAVPLEIQVSADGESWEKVEVLKGADARWEVDLSGRRLRARYLRLQKRGRDFLHLQNVRVYGKRLS